MHLKNMIYYLPRSNHKNDILKLLKGICYMDNMSDKDFLCDLYLYFIEKPNDLYLIKGLQYEDAREAAYKWFKAGENRDYMLVTEGCKPYDEQASITEVSLDWIDSQ